MDIGVIVKKLKTISQFSVFNYLCTMKRDEISHELYIKILECFIESLMSNGLKATTMDSIASSLQMSKRSLYEIFSNKEDLFREALLHFHKKMGEKMSQIFLSSPNIMEAIIKCFIYNRDLMSGMSADFMKDMADVAAKEHFLSESDRSNHYQNLYEVLQRGVREGYFRDDVNLMVQCRMLTIQMQSLKHTEELFPPDITLLNVYDSIIIGFLRGISSEKGLAQLEKYMPGLTNPDKLK